MEDTTLSDDQQTSTMNSKDKFRLALIIAAVVLVIAGVVVAIVLLFKAGDTVTAQIRDVFIILLAFVSLIIGAALVILAIQLAVLTNLIQHEIKPILDATNQTVNTLKGTTTFLSDNLVQPVIKLNEYLAGFKKIVDLIRPGKK
jgi:ABC-type transport system involved in cytochrome bd biosynthesis fused ATPase/permease subunit